MQIEVDYDSLHPASDACFGVCPHCKKNDGFINIGRGHWFYCIEHKVAWCIGFNLFSSWRDQTEDEQREIYERLEFDKFEQVKPLMIQLC